MFSWRRPLISSFLYLPYTGHFEKSLSLLHDIFLLHRLPAILLLKIVSTHVFGFSRLSAPELLRKTFVSIFITHANIEGLPTNFAKYRYFFIFLKKWSPLLLEPSRRSISYEIYLIIHNKYMSNNFSQYVYFYWFG